jgi:hypothetical protein
VAGDAGFFNRAWRSGRKQIASVAKMLPMSIHAHEVMRRKPQAIACGFPAFSGLRFLKPVSP